MPPVSKKELARQLAEAQQRACIAEARLAAATAALTDDEAPPPDPAPAAAKPKRERTPYGMLSKAQIRRRDRGEVTGRDLDRRDDARAGRRGFGAYGGARSERDDGSHSGMSRADAFDLVSGSGMPAPGDRDRGW